MNILLWYLPYAIFSDACDCDDGLSESETRTLTAKLRRSPPSRAKAADRRIYSRHSHDWPG